MALLTIELSTHTCSNGGITMIIVLLLLLAGCSTITPPSPPITKGWHAHYNTQITKELGPNHLAYNSSPSYWHSFYQALGYSESALNPFTTYWERSLGEGGYEASTGKKFLSEGLFQLSYVDATNYFYKCTEFAPRDDLNKADDDKTKIIFNPAKQISCAIRIMEMQLGTSKKPIFTYRPCVYYGKKTRCRNYWLVLHPDKQDHQRFLKALTRSKQND